jgi:UDP-glucuronate 4-epimerase
MRTDKPLSILVTGAAGFIGFHLCRRLLEDGHRVFGVDNLNEYYEVSLKHDRLALLTPAERFKFIRLDIADRPGMQELFAAQRFEIVVNLAAQAGVRYSLVNPYAYIESNIQGFLNVLEGCRHNAVGHLVYASSSSVYGANSKLPFSESDKVDSPISMYAATKRANELMAHTYSHLFGLPTTGLRFFTVYGPWGRPDMAAFLFARAIVAGQPIRVFNHGDMRRDFTYIDDIVEGVVRTLANPGGYQVFNIGNNRPVRLLDFIAILEELLGRKAVVDLQPIQPGDVPATYADVQALAAAVGFAPATDLRTGLSRFISWFQDYYKQESA